jgi:hypothetical protein
MFPHCQQLDLKQGNFLVILKQTIIFPPRQTGAKTSQTGVKTNNENDDYYGKKNKQTKYLTIKPTELVLAPV